MDDDRCMVITDGVSCDEPAVDDVQVVIPSLGVSESGFRICRRHGDLLASGSYERLDFRQPE